MLILEQIKDHLEYLDDASLYELYMACWIEMQERRMMNGDLNLGEEWELE